MDRRKRHTIYTMVLMLSSCSSVSLIAQNIESMATEKPFSFSGNVNAQFLSYTTTRERPSRDPFVWTVSGSPTISIYGFSVPFSFVFSQKQRDFRQPFNQFGMSPYYKWIKFHFGYRNVNFSRYTLAGHTFLGTGVEATPGNFRFGFVYGRFLKAVEDDSLNLEYIIPAFKRNGHSVKVGYGTQSNYVDLIMFKAKDDATSIQTDSTLELLPAENLVFGVKTFQRFLKNFTLDLDFGYSIFTYNIDASEVGLPDIPMQSFMNALTTINNSTNVNWAGNGSLNYSQGVFGLRFRYQRIQPEYQTMGAYFFNNDLEQITFDPSVNLFQRKLNIRGSVGFQKNNLGGDKVNDTFRQINSININYSPGQKFTVNGSYMNYRIDQSRNPLIIKDFVDSLRMKQVSTNFSVNLNYNLGTQELRHTVSVGTYYQKYNDENPNTEVHNASSSQSPFLSYRFNKTKSGFSVYGRINSNFFETAMNTQSRLGLTVGGSKRMAGDKLNLNASGTYYNNKVGKESNGATSMVRVQLNYQVVKSHNVNFSLNYINREFKSDASNNFNEFLIRFGYAMRIR